MIGPMEVGERTHPPTRSPGPRSRLALLPLLTLLLLAVASGCVDRSGEERTHTLATFDTLLMELGHAAPERMTRIQRWRMISSIWVGLPPPSFSRQQLPNPNSRSAGLLEAYCTQCHWLPAPQMHSAEEWPLLVRRMILRARSLAEHLGGPVTSRLVQDQRVLGGIAITTLPSRSDEDSLVAYLTENALPTADPADLPPSDGREIFVEICTRCHQTPSPAAHIPSEWPGVVDRMQANMDVLGVEELSQAAKDTITRYLQEISRSSS